MIFADTYVLADVFESYARALDKCVIIVDRIGINASSDQDAIDNALAFYGEVLPGNVFPTFEAQKFFVLVSDDKERSIEFARENFPKSGVSLSYPEMKVNVKVYDNTGFLAYTNGLTL